MTTKKPATGGRFAVLQQTPIDEPAIGPRRGRPPGKRSSQDFRPLTVYVPRDLHTRMKIRLYGEQREFSQFVADAFETYLATIDNSAALKSRTSGPRASTVTVPTPAGGRRRVPVSVTETTTPLRAPFVERPAPKRR